MIDSRGQTVVNPNVPLGLSDFQNIYTGGGADPKTVANNLWFNAPTAGRSYMEDQWSKLGIPGAPEDYFSKSTPPPSGGASAPAPSAVAGGWPVFPDEASKQVALANGSYDPSFPSPAAKIAYLAGSQVRSNDAAQTAAQAAQYNPIAPQYDAKGNLANPQSVLQGQTAGDVNGHVTSVLRSMQGTLGTLGAPIKPYVAGYGNASTGPGGNVNIDNLDRNVFHDPQFQKILARDPSGAAFAYQRLTGRDMNGDIKSAQDLVAEQKKTGLEFTQKALAGGAKRDQDGTWLVPNPAPAPPNPDALSLTGGGQSPRLIRQLVKATPTENMWMNQHFTNATGRPNVAPVPYSPASIQGANQAMLDPDVAKEVQERERIVGQKANPNDILKAAQYVANQKAGAIDPNNPHGPVTNAFLEYGNALMGLNTPQGQDPALPVKNALKNPLYSVNPANQNWWGHALSKLGQAIDTTPAQ